MTTKKTNPIAAIKKELNKAAGKLNRAGKVSNKEWTKGVKDALVALGNRRISEKRRDNGYVTCASGSSIADDGEWLYDVCWLNYEDNNRKGGTNPLHNVVLAAESEWSVNDFDLDDDFTKLIVSRADFRVFICWMANKKKREALVRRLKMLVSKSEITADGDEYLIACGDNKTGRFHFTPFTGAEAKRKS